MKYTVENSRHLKLIDADGNHIKYAFEFNDDTCIAQVYVTEIRYDGKVRVVVENSQVVKKSVHLPGAKMVRSNDFDE